MYSNVSFVYLSTFQFIGLSINVSIPSYICFSFMAVSSFFSIANFFSAFNVVYADTFSVSS